MPEGSDKYSWTKRALSFKFAFQGMRYAWSTQHNLWIHSAAAILVIAAGLYFEINTAEWLAIIICISSVLMAELFNTAIEELVNLVSPEFNPIAGRVKDVAAAAVLLSALGSVVVALIIFLPKIKMLLA
jgi:diacylglycerol kinase (ATP)